MQHKDETDGRRPLLLNNRQMLQSICDNLSHVRDARADDALPQLHKKAVNLSGENKPRNAAYNQNVLQKIRESLSPFAQDPSGESSAAGSDTDSTDRLAYDYKVSSNVTDVKSAVAIFNRLNMLNTNGISKMTGNSVRPARRSSLTDDIHRMSPVSDISIHSDSSGVSSPPGLGWKTVIDPTDINGHDTPPPVPPRQPIMPNLQQSVVARQINADVSLSTAGHQVIRRSSPVDQPSNTLNNRVYHASVPENHVLLTHQPKIMQNGHPKSVDIAQRNVPQLQIQYTPPPPYQKRAASPISVPQNIEVTNLTHAPMQGVGAIPSPVIMPAVRSRKVQHPTVHMASAPGPQHSLLHSMSEAQHPILHANSSHLLQAALRPSLQTHNSVLQAPLNQQMSPNSHLETVHGLPVNRSQMLNQNTNAKKKFVSLVHTQVNFPHSAQSTGLQQMAIVPNAALQVLPNKHSCHIEIRNSSTMQLPSHTSYPAPPQSPRNLVHIHISNSQNRGIYGVPYDGGSRRSITPSTPRSDSPISRTTNQSPVSYLSTTSTNSDQIPDRPPPPYPGRNLRNQPPVPPPRVPISAPFFNKTVAYPPQINYTSTSAKDPTVNSFAIDNCLSADILNQLNSANISQVIDDKEVSDSFTDNASIEDLTTDDNQSDISERSTRPWCTSPIPERTWEAQRNDITGDCIIRNLCPDAFKFFMEQRIENVMKSYQQRIQRHSQLENEMEKVDLSQEARDQMRRILHRKESNYIRLKRAKMDKSMFDYIKVLGRGAFGEVALVRKKQSNLLYAMKTLRKSDVLNRNQVAHVKAERDILAEADNEWVVRLYYSFQDENNLYFVMDYVAGGDLMGLLIKFEIFSEDLAKFYIAELVLAIESVHKMGFIHRDIKPDNILIDRNGHIKLTDFGLCTGFRWTHNSKYYQKEGLHEQHSSLDMTSLLDDRDVKPLDHRRQQQTQRCLAHSLVGTPNYIAPEVLLAEGYTACCDWWSVGVIFYEMVIGQPPFSANSPEETQYKVINWKDNLKMPILPEISHAAKDLVIKLCCAAKDRLGSNGATEIKKHAFFRSIEFEGLRQQTAPHVPTISYPTDTSNFDPVDTHRTQHSEGNFMDDIGHHAEHAFYEFTFRRFFDNDGHPYPQVKDAESNSPVYV